MAMVIATLPVAPPPGNGFSPVSSPTAMVVAMAPPGLRILPIVSPTFSLGKTDASSCREPGGGMVPSSKLAWVVAMAPPKFPSSPMARVKALGLFGCNATCGAGV